MKVRALDKNHDWTLGHKTQSEAIAQNVKTAILSLYNDWFLDLEHGIKWFDYFEKNTDTVALEQDIKNSVLSVDGVVSLDEFDLSSVDRQVKIELSYTDVFNKQNKVLVDADNR